MSTSLLLVVVLTVSGVVVLVQAAEMIKYLAENADYPGMCYDSEEQMAVKVGSSSAEGRCARLICRKCTPRNKCYGLSEGYHLVTQTCGHMDPKPPCYHGDDKKSYPECCQYPRCR